MNFLETDDWYMPNAIWIIVTFLLQIVVGILMIFKTDWVARKINIDNVNDPLHLTFGSKELLSIGIRLLGLYFFVASLSSVEIYFKAWLGSFSTATVFDHIRYITRLWIYLLPLYLLFGWRRITDILDRPAKVEKTEEITS